MASPAGDAAERQRQLSEAVEWALEHGKRGFATAHRKDGSGAEVWPLATEGAVDRRLDAKVDGEIHSAVLLAEEELAIAQQCNGHKFTAEHISGLLMDVLKKRAFSASQPGSGVLGLSWNAKQMLTRNKIGSNFFRRRGGWYSRHPDTAEEPEYWRTF